MATHINNVYGIRINNLMNNGSLNLGNVLHKGHQANVKMSVGYFQAGDANNSPLQFNNVNHTPDSDVLDQGQSQV